MIEYIKGKLVELNPAEAVLETVSGVAYNCQITVQSFSTLRDEMQGPVKLFIHHILREDDEAYYGFTTKEEREMFRMLLSANGVGASTARLMLSSLSVEDLRNAILAEDLHKIKSVKGVGLKTAQRLIVDLKDKIVKGSGNVDMTTIFTQESNKEVDEAVTALVMLGFKSADVQKVTKAIIKATPGLKTEEIIKLALQKL